MLLQKSLIEYTRLNFKACQHIKNLHNTKKAQTNFYQNSGQKSNFYLEPLKSSKLFKRQPNFIDNSLNHGNILSRNYSSKSTYYIQNPFKWSNNHMKLLQIKRTGRPHPDWSCIIFALIFEWKLRNEPSHFPWGIYSYLMYTKVFFTCLFYIHVNILTKQLSNIFIIHCKQGYSNMAASNKFPLILSCSLRSLRSWSVTSTSASPPARSAVSSTSTSPGTPMASGTSIYISVSFRIYILC